LICVFYKYHFELPPSLSAQPRQLLNAIFSRAMAIPGCIRFQARIRPNSMISMAIWGGKRGVPERIRTSDLWIRRTSESRII